MTYPQFINAVEAVAKELRWQVKLAFASIAPDVIKDEDFPLFSIAKEERVMRMDNALEIQSIANS
jgi:hypothetical protein